jgi:hypothetical protein
MRVSEWQAGSSGQGHSIDLQTIADAQAMQFS